MGPSKKQKANDLGVTILSEDEFIKMISEWGYSLLKILNIG